MKKFVIAMVVIILLGAVLIGVGCAVYFSSDLRFGSVDVKYTERLFESEDEFSAIDMHLADAHKVTFERGDKCSVKYFDSDVTSISVAVENGKLVISERGWTSQNWFKRLFYKFKTTDIVITVPSNGVLDIKGALDGATEMNLPSWEYGTLDFTVRGAATVVATDITASNMSVNVSGAAKLTLSGTVNDFYTHVSGSLKMVGNSLSCPQINVRASGSAELDLSGTGSVLNVHVSGSSRIRARDYSLDRVDIDVSGSVNAELRVSTYLKVDTSGSSHISYWGDPKVEKHTSGSSTIEQKG